MSCTFTQTSIQQMSLYPNPERGAMSSQCETYRYLFINMRLQNQQSIEWVYASITMVLNSFKIYYIDLINVFIEAQFPKFLFNHFQHWWRMEWVKKSNSINLYKKVEKRRYPLRGLTFTFIHNSIGNISQRSIVAFNDYIWHFKFFYVIPIRTSKYASAILMLRKNSFCRWI